MRGAEAGRTGFGKWVGGTAFEVLQDSGELHTGNDGATIYP